MLSGETAAGKYPVEAVKTTHSLALTTESCLDEFGYLQKIHFHSANVVTEAISGAVTTMAKDLEAAAIISLSETGFTSRLISKHRPECPILAITGSERAARRLLMNWGVTAVLDTQSTLFSYIISMNLPMFIGFSFVHIGLCSNPEKLD